mgnify:CR=1 FL=1
MPIPSISTLISAILLSFIILDSTGSSLDNIFDASSTIFEIRELGSSASELFDKMKKENIIKYLKKIMI